MKPWSKRGFGLEDNKGIVNSFNIGKTTVFNVKVSFPHQHGDWSHCNVCSFTCHHFWHNYVVY